MPDGCEGICNIPLPIVIHRTVHMVFHGDELKQFYAVRRTLRAEFPDGKFDKNKLLTEYAQLQTKHKEISVKFKEVQTESRRLWSIKFNIESAVRNQEKQREQMPTKQIIKRKRKDDEAL